MSGRKTDKIVSEKYPHAEIFRLERVKKIKKSRFAAGALLEAFTDFVDPNDVLDAARNINKHFYLVQDDGQFYLVVVEKDVIHAAAIEGGIAGEQFEQDGYIYVNRGMIK